MESNNHIKIDVEKYTTLRKEFHKIPQLGYKEYKTKDLIMKTLNSLNGFKENAKVFEVGDTGIFIDVYGKKKMDYNNKRLLISLRADMDGLPFKETSELEYKSIHEGRIHGCGHDGHLTVLIATIEYYLENIDKIPEGFGVRFLFQSAEEGLNGAQVMIDGGCLDGVSEIYSIILPLSMSEK